MMHLKFMKDGLGILQDLMLSIKEGGNVGLERLVLMIN